MKFAEFPYERPDLQTAMAQLDTLSRSIAGAPTAEDAKKAFYRLRKSRSGSEASLPSAMSATR